MTREPGEQNKPYIWTLMDGLDFVRGLADALEPAGYGVALAGSVLRIGCSKKDLDIIIFPHTTESAEIGAARELLLRAGMRRDFDAEVVRKRWRRLGSNDMKFVEVWSTREPSRRVDIFFMEFGL